MSKYGRGLNREIVAAVNSGLISEPFSTKYVRNLIAIKKWDPGPSEKHINVTLANAASDEHSPTYKKYFESVATGLYKVKSEYKSQEWL